MDPLKLTPMLSVLRVRLMLFLIVSGLVLMGGLACGGSTSRNSGRADTSRTIPFDREGRLAFLQDGDSTVTIDIEIAETDSARERGMMERDGFPNDRSGMLFLFPEEETRSFWMANTPVALDIFYVNADSQVVSITKYTTPFSSEQIQSGDPAQFVVETPAGFADSHGILEGDRIRWWRLE